MAVIREEGSNGDREMAAAFVQAGFIVHDVTMSDLAKMTIDLNNFQGLAFPGGFSYAGKNLFNAFQRQHIRSNYDILIYK